jgi:SAM-dependent methyltransferase
MIDPSTLSRAAAVLDVDVEHASTAHGYLDLIEPEQEQPTGIAQRLMRSRVVPLVYERWWRPALGRIAKGPRGPSMPQEQRLARQLLELQHGDTVLDVACGPGNFTRVFAADVGTDGTAIGIDLSATMLARAVADTDLPQVAYVRADITDLPAREASVDAVCCFAALHLFADPWAALDVMTRALVPGGRLAILTSARPTARPGASLTTVISRAADMRVFAPGEIVRALALRDLTVTDHRTFGAAQLVGARR